jgi:hypothetical protein
LTAAELRVLQSFRRVLGWFGAHPEAIPAQAGDGGQAPALATQIDALTGVVGRLTDHGTDQKAQALQSTLISKDEKDVRNDVRAHLRGIVQVAQALRGTVPGIGMLKMPASNIQAEPLVGAAESMSRSAAIYQDVLTEHGLPKDFVAQLDTTTTKLRQSIDARGAARSRRAGASKGITEELALGRRIVSLMDATLQRTLRTEPVPLAEWRHAKRVTTRSGAVRTTIADSTPAVTPVAKTA